MDGDGDHVASSFALICILNEKPHLLCQLLHSVAVNVGEEQLHLAAEKVASDVSEARWEIETRYLSLNCLASVNCCPGSTSPATYQSQILLKSWKQSKLFL